MLAAGVIVTTPAAAQQASQPLSVTRGFRLDGDRAGLSSITDLTVLRDGTIAITQPDDAQVLLMDSNGTSIRRIGRRGAGPGEFAWPNTLGAVDNQVWIVDDQLKRLTFYSTSGKLIRTVPLPTAINRTGVGSEQEARGRGIPVADLMAVAAIYPNGDLLYDTFVPSDAHQPAAWRTAIGDAPGAYFRLRADGTVVSLAATLKFPNHDCWQTIRGHTLTVPECLEPVWDVSSDASRFVVATVPEGDPTGFTVVSLDGNDDTVYSVRLAFEPDRITPRVADSIRNRVVRDARSPQMAAAARELKLPNLFPPVDYLVAGRDTTTWIGLRPVGAVRTWLELDPRGNQRGTVQLPRSVRIREAESTTLWGTDEDRDGVQSVVRYTVVSAGH